MSLHSHIDALIWAAASDAPPTAGEAAEILGHARSVRGVLDPAVPPALAARIDELVQMATEAAAGEADAMGTLRALLRSLIEGGATPGPASIAEGETADADLIEIFLASCTESLAEIEANLLTIEDDPDSQEALDSAQDLKRSMHTLKGECGVLSLHGAQAVWHEAETLLESSLELRVSIPTGPLVAALDWHRAFLVQLAVEPDRPAPGGEGILEIIRKAARALGVHVEPPAGRPAGPPAEPSAEPSAGPAPGVASGAQAAARVIDDSALVEFTAEALADESIPEFATEARQHLEETEAALLEIEEDGKASDCIDRMFRAFHTIKGVAGFLGLDPITRLAHSVETLLDKFRGTDLAFTSVHADAVLEARDLMAKLVDAAAGGAMPRAAVLDTVVAGVTAMAENPLAAKPVGTQAILRTLETAGLHDRDAIREASSKPGSATRRLGELLKAQGALTEAALEEALEQQAEMRAEGRTPRLGEVLVALGVATQDQVDLALQTQDGGGGIGSLLAEPVEAEPQAKAATRTQATGDTTIRVSTHRLDSLVDMVGELVIAQQMVVQDSAREAPDADDRLGRNMAHLSKITRDLQQASMSLRMVTFKSTFQKMHRLVRDVSSRAGKNVRLVIEGADTEVDRNVVDKISDPLVHLVRNAIDHGLEPTADRAAAGKSEQGTVTLSARHQGGAIVVTLTDDGRGLDRERIVEKAKEKGLLPRDRKASDMADSAIFALIFEAGFSTAASVTDISGRGVGMDVVRRNIETMRGKIEIHSTEGRGSEFQVHLPLTLAIIDAMIVIAEGERYVIPTLAIVQCFRPQGAQLHQIRAGDPVVEVRGQLVPLYRLGRVLDGHGMNAFAEQATLILVEGMGRRACLMVDEIVGQQQVVIKKLGASNTSSRVVSGGAILGDGRVALIIDIEGVLAESETVTVP